MTPIDSIRKFQEGKALMLEGLSVMRQAVHDFEGVFLEWSEEAAEFDYTHANGAVEIPLTQDKPQPAPEPAKEPEPVETTQADPEPVEATPEPTETTPEPVDEAPSAPVVSLDEVRAAAAAKARSGHGGEVKQLLAKYNVAKLSEVPADSYAAFLEEVKAIA